MSIHISVESLQGKQRQEIMYHLNNPGEHSPREAIRLWKRHVYPLTWCAEMSMDGEGDGPNFLERGRSLDENRGECVE
ncbi:MAG: hypothetical protein NVS4B12_29320 [Ktedonobacteraceae bacterium]